MKTILQNAIVKNFSFRVITQRVAKFFPSSIQYFLLASLLVIAIVSCEDEEEIKKDIITPTTSAPSTTNARVSSASIGIVGSEADVTTTTTGGTVLMGGSVDVDEAIEWMINKSGGGDFVVIRASGTDGYNDYIYDDLGGVNSVETLLINSRTLANNVDVEATIRNAEAVFIAGGDQANYFNYWKDTKVEDALNYLINTKKCPVGGTSAGCAIMGKVYFTAQNGTITTSQALSNPYNSKLTLQRDNFLNNAFLANTVTDTHFDNPDRRGRLTTFMARMSKDWSILPKGIGVEEETAVCIDQSGNAKIFGYGDAFFAVQTTTSGIPERCVSGSSLDWYRSKQAVKVYRVAGTTSGSNTFNLVNWTGTGGSSLYFYVDRGAFKTY